MEENRSDLNFKKNDKLSAHKAFNDERIDDSVLIRDIAHFGTVVIKCTGTRADREDTETHKKHGLALISEKQDGTWKDIRQRGDLSESGAPRRDNTTTADQGEIKSLTLKLKTDSDLKVEGFVFTIVPEDYKHGYKESESSLTFFSEKEYKEIEKRSNIRVIPCWSDWQPRKELPCWGVRITNTVGKDNSSKQLHRNKNQEISKIPIAIVTKTSFYQVREFGVKVTINKKAVKEAKKVLEASTEQAKRTTVKKFNDKYCSCVYSGKFSAGAWLKTVAIARRFKGPKGQDSTNLEKCAAEETEHYWSWVTQRDRHYQHLESKDPRVRVSLADYSHPPRIKKMYELERKIGNVENCTIFPANWDDKSDFTPVYEIMKRQAEANNDEDLRQVSDIFKEYMEGKTAFSLFGGLVGICDKLQHDCDRRCIIHI